MLLGQLGKELGVRWKQLSEEEKKKYKELALKQAADKQAAAAENGGSEQNDGEKTEQTSSSKAPFPASIVKRLIMSDPDLKRISGPSLNLVMNATEAFIGMLTERATSIALSMKRKTIRFSDIEIALKEGGWRLSFAADHLKEVSKFILQEKENQSVMEVADKEKEKDVGEDATASTTPVKRITDFWGK